MYAMRYFCPYNSLNFRYCCLLLIKVNLPFRLKGIGCTNSIAKNRVNKTPYFVINYTKSLLLSTTNHITRNNLAKLK